jgi:taurine transport system permease protein
VTPAAAPRDAPPPDTGRARSVDPRVLAWILGSAGVAVALVAWAALAQALAGGGGVISRLPSPSLVIVKWLAYARGDLLADLLGSLRVFAIGWLIGVVAATFIGVLLGRVQTLGRIFLPIVEALRPVSSIVWVPLSVVWFGFGLSGKVFLVALAVFLVVIVYAVDGSTRIASDVARSAAMLGMNAWQRFRHVILPGTLSEVLIGSRVSLMSGWGTVIVAELVAADAGLGAHLIAVQQSYDVGAVVATMICFGASGFVMNALFSIVERWLLPWRRAQGTLQRA